MKKSLFSNIPHNLQKELIESLIQTKNCRIERIISKGQATPEGKWYCEKQNEFVLLIKGEADLLIKNKKIITLRSGDYINIPSHVKHRVERTSKKEETIWLAVFYTN